MQKQKVSEGFWDWLNAWADFDKHKEARQGKYITDFGRGYKQAVEDIHNKTTK